MTPTEIILDPEEVVAGRTELALNTGAIRVGPGGPDWGDAQIEQHLAKQRYGQVPVDFRVPNRPIAIPLVLGADGAAGYDDARTELQEKVGLLQREGGVIRRGTSLYADVVGATLAMPDQFTHLGIGADVILTLEALPDFYGPEVQLEDGVLDEFAGSDVAVFTLDDVPGDYPARTRIVVELDEDAEPQRGAVIAVRSRHYDAALEAALQIDGPDLTALDASAAATVTGRSVLRHQALLEEWTPVALTDLVSGPLTHVGTYQVWARLHTTDTPSPRVRLVWQVGELDAPTENTPIRLPSPNALHTVCLGEIRLDQAPVGNHQWQGQIQAAGDAGGEDISIEALYLLPVDESYTILRAPDSQVDFVSYTARDSFTGATNAADLNGRTPQVGAAWATSGATTDLKTTGATPAGAPYFLDAAVLYRDVASATPRYAVLGPVMTDQRVSTFHQVINSGETLFGGGHVGVIARWVDANNHLKLTVRQYTLTGTGWAEGDEPYFTVFWLRKVVGGTPTTLGYHLIDSGAGFVAPIDGCTLDLSVSAAGDAVGKLLDATGQTLATLTAQDAVLATGGVLDDGKAGLIDEGDGTNTAARVYDFVAVSDPPPTPAVVYPGQLLELRHDGAYRQNETGTAYGKVPHVTGDLPRLPPSGMEDRPCEVLVKTSRGDFEQLPDAGLDSFVVRVYARPCFLFPITA